MNIIVAIIVLSVIIIIHEAGHFILARANKVAVKEFALGLGPSIIKHRFGQTIFSLKLLPFGGACIMAGEDGTDAGNADPDSLFASKSVWARISIIAAGPIFNFILAFILAVFIIGSIGYSPCRIYSVDEGTVGFAAGLEPGDRITEINGKKVVFYEDFSIYYEYHLEKELNITYERNGQEYKTSLIPQYIEMDVYQLGVTLLQDGTINSVSKGMAADVAGLKVNDIVVAINGDTITDSSDITDHIRNCGGNALVVTVKRGNDLVSIEATPTLNHYSYYETGLSFSAMREKVNPIKTLGYSASYVRFWISSVFESLRLLFTGNVTKDDVAGPVGIVSAIGNVVEQSKSDGIYYIILNLANWVVMLSANLGVMNLLPIPALDGGRLLFLIVEAFRGKPIDQQKEGFVHFVGMVLLMILMVFILFNDISNLF